ncbi:MAG: adenylate kinase family protein [Thermoplasmata archaeon]|nr:adenylate kinase family protein [Thermoplasmata archaeon]
MLVAISGTPGVGKSAVSEELKRQSRDVLNLDEVADERGFLEGEEKGSRLVNLDKLKDYVKALESKGDLFLVSHYSHLIAYDVAIVLRCHPKALKKRLEKRSWSKAKVFENVEAEAIDVITVEALENGNRVYEVDATESKPETVVETILKILDDGDFSEKFRPGNIDWSEEVMKWY